MNSDNSRYLAAVDCRARRKLERIIDRYGDADGERLKSYYLDALRVEVMRADLIGGQDEVCFDYPRSIAGVE